MRARATRARPSATHASAATHTIWSSSTPHTGSRPGSGRSSRSRSRRVLAPGARVVGESDRRAPLELRASPSTDERRYGDTLIRIHSMTPEHRIAVCPGLLRPDHQRPPRRHRARRDAVRRGRRRGRQPVRSRKSKPLFDIEERIGVHRATRPRICGNVRAEPFDILVVDFARSASAPRDRQGPARDLRLRVRAGDEPAQPPAGARRRVPLPDGQLRSTVSSAPAASRSSPPSAATSTSSCPTRRTPLEGRARPLTNQRSAMDVLVLIDKLDDLVHNAKPVPLTDQVRVDKEEIYDILDQMRATIPEEIKQARWIVKERQEMLAEAKREAERIVKEARERQDAAGLRGGGHQAGRARRRGHHRGRPRPRARDPPRRRGLRRRDPQHARGQPLEVHRGRAARPRAPAGQGRARRSRLERGRDRRRGPRLRHHDAGGRRDRQRREHRPRPRRRRRGAISRAGGPAVQRESDAQGADRARRGGRDDAPATCPRRWVIHAATMVLGGPTSADVIRRATAATLSRADELGARSLALVAFGTGVGGFPLDEAARDRGRGGPPPPRLRQRPRARRVRRPR